jgi:hypothetical protein
MLKKKICFKCTCVRHKETKILKLVFDELWKNGNVSCFAYEEVESEYTSAYSAKFGHMLFFSDLTKPPEKCPYILEHVMG